MGFNSACKELNPQHVMNCRSFSQSATVGYSNTVFPSSLFILLN